MKDARDLGSFESLEDVWDLYPYGGCPGDYVRVGDVIIYWNDNQMVWGNSGNNVSTTETQHVEGNLIVDGDLTIGGNTKGENASFKKISVESLEVKNPPYANIEHLHDDKYAGKKHKHNVSDINGFDGDNIVLPGTIENAKNAIHAESSCNLDEDSPVFEELKNLFLSKARPDQTEHLLELLGGIAFHDGYGITPDGEAFLHILRLTGFLEAPEYRFNRIDVTTGDKWNAPGGGVIESVDIENQIITLKLEDGEVGAIELDDICMSIFHNKEILNNATSTIDDGRGNRMIVGFATSYFRIVDILDDRKQTFRYALRGVSDRWNMSIHPSPMSHFPVYGNFSNPERQSSSYSTRTYTRFLRNVSDWEFSAYNVAAQFGDQSNLSAFGLDMTGYSAYLDNIYMTGRIDMSAHIPDRMEFEASNGYSLSVGEYTDITAYLYNGWDDITEKYTGFIWTRDSGVAQEDAAWNIAHKTSEKTLTLSFADLNTRRVVFSCTATKPGAKAIVGNLIV